MSYKKITLILFLGIFLLGEKNASAQVQSVTFSYTGAVQTWTVPSCVAFITIDCYGAEGIGVTNEIHPALGGEARGVATVASNQVCNIYVGGQASWNGGGVGQNGANGGDASDVRIGGNALANRIIVAGGGGGSGGDSWSCFTDSGNGGKGLPVGSNFMGGGGGAGYGGCGTDGGNTGGIGYAGNCHGGGGGGGGFTTGGGGSIATCGSFTAQSGALGLGGNAYIAPGCASEGAGGGGGGYYGGGGVAGYSCGAGQGGGGSSWTGTLASPYFREGRQVGKGMVIISWTTDSVGSVQPNVYQGIVCAGQSFASASIFVNHVPAGGSFTYTWAPSGGSRDTATGLTAGTYTVNVVGCGSASAIVTITQPGFLTASPFTTNMNCNGQIASGIANPGISGGAAPFTYLWAPSGLTTATIGGLSFTTYSLSVTDNHGCKTTALLTVTQPNPLVITASSVIPVTCSGGKNGVAVSNVTGGTSPYMYAWAPSGGSNASANGLSAGVYTLNITDSKGCTGAGLITVSQPPALAVVVSPLLNIACNGDNNGVLGAGVDGGVRPYAYAWTGGGGNDSNASNLSAGVYAVTVTDANGCITKVNGTITQPAVLGITIDTTLNSGYCTGSAWVVLAGGTPPYNYSWSNGSTNFFQDSLCDGLYCCTVTDAHGCITNTCAHIGTSLGIGNITSGSTPIKIYPNPSNGQFAIQSSAGDKSIVVIYNVLGEKVYTSELNSGGNTVINISSQPVGIYLYRVISSVSGSELGEGKIVLQK